ncbi:hypothetical protein BB560_006691 [Smittium megazygosporum]|uniref:Endoplasmic reticulum junction formation protein lunapark n=1 Tax=Smittium megazygosporum TaxID=133381 RepID=A0A2T9Y2F7_9FUNG|nr:hypothetical protein BB560_006691 [Smittium megazygosporum]
MWLFRRKKASFFEEEDYEFVLQNIQQELSENLGRLDTLHRRKQTASTTWVIYSGVGWVVFSGGFWFYGSAQNLPQTAYTICLSISVFGLPIIYYTNKLICYYFNKTIKNQEKSIKTLKDSQKEKIKELKEKTKFDTTRQLIERYEPSVITLKAQSHTPSTSNMGSRQQSMSARPLNVTPSSGKFKFVLIRVFLYLIFSNRPLFSNTNPIGPSGVVNVSRQEQPSKPKVWLDNFVEKIVGIDDIQGTRYALICAKCYSHNGLALPEEVNTVQYTCPKCGFFNQSRDKLMQRKQLAQQNGTNTKKIKGTNNGSDSTSNVAIGNNLESTDKENPAGGISRQVSKSSFEGANNTLALHNSDAEQGSDSPNSVNSKPKGTVKEKNEVGVNKSNTQPKISKMNSKLKSSPKK